MELLTYTPEQRKEIVDLISENYGSGEYMAHETKSEFVHTDVNISDDGEKKSFVTFGMGAARMNAPLEVFERIELVMQSSLDDDVNDYELLYGLIDLSKYPFRNNTWFGMGHTVDVSKRFADTFGYEYVLLAPTSLVFSPSDTTNNVKNVVFLEIIPIYADEREWIVENNSFVYMDLLYNMFGDDMFKVDVKREHYIPKNEDVDKLNEL